MITSFCLFPICFSNKENLISEIRDLINNINDDSFENRSKEMLQRYDSKKDCIVILCQNSDELKKFAGKILNCSDLSVIADQKNLFYCRDRISDPKIVYVYPPGGLVDESIVNKYLEQFEVEDDKITSILRQTNKYNKTVSDYLSEVAVNKNAMKILECIGVCPDIAIGASMGELSMLICSDSIKTRDNTSKSNEEIITDIGNIINKVVLSQSSYAGEHWGYERNDIEKWYLKGNVEEIIPLIDDENIFVLVIGSDEDMIVCGIGSKINELINSRKLLGYKLVGADYIHTKIISKTYDQIREAIVNDKIYLETDSLGYSVYSTYYNKKLDDSVKMFAENIAHIFTDRVDFRNIVKKSFDDGGRIYIDFGSRNICQKWIKTLLKDNGAAIYSVFGKEQIDLHILSIAANLMANGARINNNRISSIFKWNNKKTISADLKKKKNDLLLYAVQKNSQAFNDYLTFLYDLISTSNENSKYVFEREELERITEGKPSEILGNEYAFLDSRDIYSRMPSPPYMFVSRITDIDAGFGELRVSSISMEYDITDDTVINYGNGEISQVIVNEASHCGIFLACYIGVDKLFNDKRKFRVAKSSSRKIGDDLFRIGDVLRINFYIDSFQRVKDILYINCHCDNYKNGMLVSENKMICGYFSDKELNESDRKVPFDRSAYKIKSDSIALTFDEVNRILHNKAKEPYTNGLDIPDIYQMIDSVTSIADSGGKYGNGYIIAEKNFTPDFWPFKAHFKNDPVLPGTIMSEAINQTIYAYLYSKSLFKKGNASNLRLKKNSIIKTTFLGQVLPTNSKIVVVCDIKKIDEDELTVDASIVFENNIVLAEKDIEIEF